jgi:hypothetical protein
MAKTRAIKMAKSQLLALVKEIDKVLPEEGTIDTYTAGTGQLTQGNHLMAE